jgi:Domain of unknown function (DUF1911)/Domain of unknown function (DUF1910)
MNMSAEEFRAKRRQIYLDEESYKATLKHNDKGIEFIRNGLSSNEVAAKDIARATSSVAQTLWETFQIRYTAGESLTALANFLAEVVAAYERHAAASLLLPDDDYYPPFVMDDLIDTYVDYVNLLSVAILLHREDLVPRIYGLIEDTDYDGADLVIEELLTPFLPDRPDIDEWLWDKPYGMLLHAKYAATPAEQVKGMKKYVKAWYPAMKGEAQFWGAHEHITPEFSPYEGYWAMCAAAFSYLFNIDDSSFRDEIVYPKDLVDYARSKPRRTVAEAQKLVPQELKRCEGGKPCPETGMWFTPAKSDSQQAFFKGSLMPIYEASDYGETIWYWVPGQVRHQ